MQYKEKYTEISLSIDLLTHTYIHKKSGTGIDYFSTHYKTPRPKQLTEGVVYFGLLFQKYIKVMTGRLGNKQQTWRWSRS